MRKKFFAAVLPPLVLVLLSPQVFAVSKSERAQVRQYCAEYAQAVAQAAAEDSPGEILIAFGKSNIFLRAMNKLGQWMFQPRNSRFVTSYACAFHNTEKSFHGKVELLLTRYKSYAEYTKWDGALFLELGEVRAESGGAYYIVPKYLEVNGARFSKNAAKNS